MGLGPMTGRAAGFCAGYGAPGYANPMPGRGFYGRGRGGGGRGFRHWFHATGLTARQRAAMYMPPYAGGFAPPSVEQQVEALKAQAAYFESALADIKKQIEEVEKQKD